MLENHKQILSGEDTRQKIKRIAYEILENNLETGEIFLAGVYSKGYRMAEMIRADLGAISPGTAIHLVKLTVNKEAPAKNEIFTDTTEEALRGKVVVLVDDVLNSGRTSAYALSYLLSCQVSKVELAALVNRSHKSFPISPTYKGYEIATMIHEYIEVQLEDQVGVYLHS